MQNNSDENATKLLDSVILGIRQEDIPLMPESLSQTELNDTYPQNGTKSGFFREHSRRITLQHVVLAATVLMCIGIGLSFFQSRQLLAQVQEAIRDASSISFDLETLYGDETIQRYHIQYSQTEGIRAESAFKLHIFNLSEKATLDIDHSSKTAKIRPVYDAEAMQAVVGGSIAELSSLRPMEQIEAKRYSEDGKEWIELWARWDRAIAHVSVDPKTMLPVRIEVDRGHNPQGQKIVEIVSNIEFGHDSSGHDYSLDIPGGYAVERIERSEPTEAVEGYVLSADGLGPITWGMSFDEVVSLVGRPDSFDASPAMVPEMKDGQPVILPGKGFKMVPAKPLHKIIHMNYESSGFRIIVSEIEGVVSIQCFDGRSGRTFPGRTVEGITIGMTREQVKEILGLDSLQDGRFQFTADRLSVMGASTNK